MEYFHSCIRTFLFVAWASSACISQPQVSNPVPSRGKRWKHYEVLRDYVLALPALLLPSLLALPHLMRSPWCCSLTVKTCVKIPEHFFQVAGNYTEKRRKSRSVEDKPWNERTTQVRPDPSFLSLLFYPFLPPFCFVMSKPASLWYRFSICNTMNSRRCLLQVIWAILVLSHWL